MMTAARRDMPSVPGDELERLERALQLLARRLWTATAHRAHRGMVPSTSVRLDRAAYVLLRELGCRAGGRVSALAAAIGLDVSTVSRELRGLERAGLVAREADPNDGRAVRLLLTATGAAALEAARARRHALLDRGLEALGAERRAVVVGALEELAAALAGDEESEDDRHGAGAEGEAK